MNYYCSNLHIQFSVLQIEYPLGCSNKKGSHVYFLLIVTMTSESESENIIFNHNKCTLVIMKVIDLLNIEVKNDFC